MAVGQANSIFLPSSFHAPWGLQPSHTSPWLCPRVEGWACGPSSCPTLFVAQDLRPHSISPQTCLQYYKVVLSTLLCPAMRWNNFSSPPLPCACPHTPSYVVHWSTLDPPSVSPQWNELASSDFPSTTQRWRYLRQVKGPAPASLSRMTGKGTLPSSWLVLGAT